MLIVRLLKTFESHLIKEVNGSRFARESFAGNYTAHEKWLEKAMLEIRSGERIAFGCFERDADHPGHPEKLHGTVMLKRGTYTNDIEIKNLIVSDDYADLNAGARKVMELLLAETKVYCEFRGFFRQISEIPVRLFEYVSFHLTQRFHVEALRDSPYSRNSKIYVVARDLDRPYVGDPLDIISFARWAITDVYGFKIPENYEPSAQPSLLLQIPFLIDPQSPLSRNQGPKLSGTCFVNTGEPEREVKHILKKSLKDHLTMLVDHNTSSSLAKFCLRNRIKFIHPSELGGPEEPGVGINHMCEDAVGGLIVECGGSTYEQLKQWETDLRYVLPNGHGTHLREREELQQVVLFGHYDPVDTAGLVILGAAKVLMPDHCTIKSAREKLDKTRDHAARRPRFWTQQEFDSFFFNFPASREVQDRVTVLNLDKIKYCDPPVPLTTIIDPKEADEISALWKARHLPDCYFSDQNLETLLHTIWDNDRLFKTPKESIGSKIFRGILLALETTAGENQLALMQELKDPYSIRTWSDWDDHPDSTPLAKTADILIGHSMRDITRSLDDLIRATNDVAASPIEIREKQRRVAEKAKQTLEPLISADLLSSSLKTRMKSLWDYFDSILRQ